MDTRRAYLALYRELRWAMNNTRYKKAIDAYRYELREYVTGYPWSIRKAVILTAMHKKSSDKLLVLHRRIKPNIRIGK